MKKYEILTNKENTINVEGRTLHRIRALRDFNDVKKGDIGGYIESECNLSQEGDCWIYDNARVFGNAWICDNACVHDNVNIYDDACVFDNAHVYGYASVYDSARVYGYAKVYDSARVYGYALVFGNAKVYGYAKVSNKKIQGKVASKFDNIVEIQNPEGRLVTCTLHGDKILYSVGCQTEITEEEFIYRIENNDGGIEKNPHRKYYYRIIEMAKIFFEV